MAKATQAPVNVVHYNNAHIIGDNVLYFNGVITAFYILPLSNYTTNYPEGILHTIQKIKDLVSSLITGGNPKVCFTIERTDKVLRAQDVISNLYDTIHIYRPDYVMPEEFVRNIQDDVQSYCILGIDLQQSALTDAEDLTIKDTIKALLKSAFNKVSGLGNFKIDPEQILKLEESTYRCIKDRCLRCTKDLVFYNFVSKLFPCYEISYDKQSYVNENNFEEIIGSITQTVSDNFGWFEMHNEGMPIFGQDSVTTYGCMLQVYSFPQYIDASNFPLDEFGYANTVTTIKCLTKEQARSKMKRAEINDKYEVDEGWKAGASMEDLESAMNNVALARMAVSNLENRGEIICEFNTVILVFAETREELKERIMHIINTCKSRDILVNKSNTQALTFLKEYVGKAPTKFTHLAPLEYPLCFQQNAGATIGDTAESSVDASGNLWWSPSIGRDLS